MNWLPGLSLLPNSHPMLVHFPIAFWVGALCFCWLGVLRSTSGLFRMGSWLLHLGTLSGVAAVVSGFLATSSMTHDEPGHDLVHVHRNFMVATAAISLAASCAVLLMRRRDAWRPRCVQAGLITLVVGLATLGADRGALLVYGYGLGVRDNPPSTTPQHAHGDAPSSPHEHK
tara:strand:+ start:1225 stop:1740 length:516 start_codon:yes stop_codon:yes gene_type:complete